MVGIIILNWNGWEDTVECLKSLYKINDCEFYVVVVDNGSTDDSVKMIKDFVTSQKDICFLCTDKNEVGGFSISGKIDNKTTILLELDENYGFAKGNNIGIEFAKQFLPEYMLMLNNDTEVEKDFLSCLINFSKAHPNYIALCPKISSFYKKDIIWNCGGNLFWGFRRYHYAGKPENTIKEKEYIEAEFVTGCAFFFRTSLVKEFPLLTEKFFFGEEDFELGYRLKRQGKKMACVLGSHIYHKVGESTKSMDSVGKKYIYYLNRYIDMKQQMGGVSYRIWKNVNAMYIGYLLHKNKIPKREIKKFLKTLFKESKELEGVSKEKFFELLNRK